MKHTLPFWLAVFVITTLAFVPQLGAADVKTGTDTDGDKYTVKLTGPGTLTVSPVNGTGPITSIAVNGANATSALTVTVVKGTTGNPDGQVSIGQIAFAGGTGSIGSITAAKSDLVGAGIVVFGGIRTLTLGNIATGSNVSLGTDPAIKTVTVKAGNVGGNILSSSPATFSLTALKVTGNVIFNVGAIGTLKTTAGPLAAQITATGNVGTISVTGGDFTGFLTTPGTLGMVSIAKDKAGVGGAIVNSTFTAKTIGTIKSAAGVTADITATGKIMALLVNGGDFKGHVSSGDSITNIGVTKTKAGVGGSIVDSFITAKNLITSVILAGNLTNSFLLAGAQLGADHEPGGTDVNADTYGIGSLKTVRIGGNVTSTIIGAGLTPVNGVFNDGSDGVIGGKLSKLDSITVGGMFDGASLLAAGAFPARVSFGDTVDFHFVSTAIIVPAPPVATALDRTTALPGAVTTAFLYTGAGAVQTGVAPGTIVAERSSVLRGRTITRTGGALAGVLITILDHPEYGQTRSRSDGQFDMAVNGGGTLVLTFDSPGYASAQRQVTSTAQDFAPVGDVALVNADAKMTTVSFGAGATMAMHEATMQNDASGARHAALVFQPGTSASLKMPDGTMHPMDSLNIRATEFTVGPMGPQAMPGVLPANSGYTYCVDLTADEATMLGATSVEFDKPVYFYVENFLNFDIGIDVPSGFYNKVTGLWEAGPSGRIIKIVSITGGVADLDVTGDDVVDTGGALTALNITTAERTRLAASYSVGQSLWRVPIPHFSAWDSNWPFGPPPDAGPPGTPPNGPPPPTPPVPSNDPPCCGGSIIEPLDQVLGERVPVSGSEFSLNYRSNRVPGYKAGNTVRIPLSGTAIPASLIRIDRTVQIAGRTFVTSFPAATNQVSTFEWDGFDAYGRELQGRQPAKITIGYVYSGVYQRTSRFGYNGNGTPISGDRTRQEVTLSSSYEVRLGTFDIRRLSLGGWTLNAHHVYDPQSRTLYLGDGTTRTEGSVNAVISTVVGSGLPYTAGFANDNIPAKDAKLLRPAFSAVTDDGSLYFTDATLCQVFRVDPAGVIHVVAGIAQSAGYNGDEQPALAAKLNAPFGIVVAPDGTIYFNDGGNRRTRGITPDGMIHTVAGNGTDGFSGDGGLATAAQTGLCVNLSRGADGSLFISDANKQTIRRVGTDGIITTVAGVGNQASFTGDNGVATAARLNAPLGTAFDANGNLSIADFNNRRIRRVGADGIIRTIAGDGNPPASPTDLAGDGGLATAAQLGLPNGLRVDRLGNVFFADGGVRRVRKITRDGLIVSVAGSGVAPATPTSPNGDGGAALQASLSGPTDVEVGPDGALYLADELNLVIRKVAPPLPGFDGGDLAIPSSDGNQLYRFNAVGRHLATVNAFTGATLFTFTYEADGQLAKITDGDGNVTKIERAMAGGPTAIVAPFGQRTTLTTDANGSLASVKNPLNQSYILTHDARGLLTGATDPAGNAHVFIYDATGRLTKDDGPGPGFTDLGRVELANGGHLVTLTNALGVVTTFQTEPPTGGGELRTVTDGAGLASVETRRADGVDISTVPAGVTTLIKKGPDARFGMQSPIETLRTITTPGGKTLIIESAQTATFADATNPLSITAFTETTKVNGNVTTLSFDPTTSTFLETSALGVLARRKVDAAGRVVEDQYGGFNPTRTTYNLRGQPSTVATGTGGDERLQKLAYTPAGLLFKYTDALGRVETYTYDTGGRLTKRQRPDGGSTGFTYDADGRLASFTPPGRAAHLLDYAPNGRLTSYTPPGGAATTYSYTAQDSPALTTRGDGATIAYTYDAAGRLQKRTVAAGDTTFQRDPITGNLASIASPGGLSVAYTYDGERRTGLAWTGPVTGSVSRTLDDHLRTATQSVNAVNPLTTTYDADGSIVSVGALTQSRSPLHGGVTATTLGSVTDTRTFTAFGEASGFSALYNGAPLFSAVYTFDKLGRVTRRVETFGAGPAATFDFTYDSAGRLSGVSGAATASFTYDANGNPTGGATTNAQDQLTSLGSLSFTYNGNGDLATRTDGAGTTTYSYDALGNLTAVARPGGLPLLEYLLDGSNRRLGKRVGGVPEKGFLYDELGRLVAELDGANALVSRFVYSDSRNVPAYMVKGGATFRIITEPLGHVRLVVNVADGSIAQRIDYDAFGQMSQDTAPGFQPFGFAGGLYDPDTRLTRFGFRDYDAEARRWLARDPLLIGSGDPNLYAYAGNDPINRTDLQGLDATQEAINAINQMSNGQGPDQATNDLINHLNDELQSSELLDRLNSEIDHLSRAIDALKRKHGHRDEIERLRDKRDKIREQAEKEAKRISDEIERKRKEEEQRRKKKPCPPKR